MEHVVLEIGVYVGLLGRPVQCIEFGESIMTFSVQIGGGVDKCQIGDV